MLKAVIFDFDGVIADSEPLHLRAFQLALQPYGVEISRETYYSNYLGYSDKDCVIEFNKEFDLGLDRQSQEKLIAEKGVFFGNLIDKENTIIDGAAEFVKMLGENLIRKAICSGALLKEIEIALKPGGFSDAFEEIIAADHVEKGKPDPEGYLLALSRLNEINCESIKPAECVVIEDSFWGLKAAENADMHRIAVTNTYSAEKLAPYSEKIINKLTDLKIDDLHLLCS